MIYGELTQRQFEQDNKGLTGTVVLVCDWADVDSPAGFILGLPHYGDPWICDDGFNTIPMLRVVRIRTRETDRYMVGPGTYTSRCEYTVEYSTERQLNEDFCNVSMDISLEAANDQDGLKWQTAGTPVMQPSPVMVPVGLLKVQMRQPNPDWQAIFGAANKVNDRTFLQCPAGTMLFHGAHIDNNYGNVGNLISAAVAFDFTIKLRGQKYFWRPPLQALDVSYNPMWYQSIDPSQPNYTTDPTLIATPVWVSGTPGVGGWDIPTHADTTPYYASCDFADVLGIPRADGDG